MKMLDKKAYEEIRRWVHCNARPLEMALWNYFFENGKREEIQDALAFYQNEDGGFGCGIEPDCWNRESSPYATLTAAGILQRTGIADALGRENPLIQGIFRYLESGAHSDEEGWFFSIPSNNTCARAPWWSFDEEANRLQGMGITAGLCAFILRYGDRDSGLYQKALAFTGRILQKAAGAEAFGEMGAEAVYTLLQELAHCESAASFSCEGLAEKMAKEINRAIERDPKKWALYTPRPSQFISSPDSPFYKGNEKIVEEELDYLIDTRNPLGVWNITWTWFDLGEKYAKEFAVSENWWMTNLAIEKTAFLKNFGRLSR